MGDLGGLQSMATYFHPGALLAVVPGEAQPWLVILVLLGAGVAFGVVPLGLARLWALYYSPAKPGNIKQATYECGLESRGDAWVRFRSEYFVYAIVFLVFDVEAVFLLPAAIAVTGLGWGAFLALFIFLLLLVEGLVWAWQKGGLRWRA